MTKLSSKIPIKAISISLLFFFSSIGASVLISPAAASPNSPAPLAAAPLTQLQANWPNADGNAFNQNYNPQNLINSSNAQYLGLSWLFPLPTHPAALLSVSGGLGVDTVPLIINGTIYFVTQYGQVFALNAANGNVLWTDVLPISANSTLGKGIGALALHMHNGDEQFTTKLFGGTPTLWISAPDQKVYAINILNGKYELNFTEYSGITDIPGNNPGAQYTDYAPANILVDQNKGIVITSIVSTSSSNTGRGFFRGWNVLVNPPQLMWTAFTTPPQPGSNIPLNPNWDAQQIATMKGASIFRGYGDGTPGGYGNSSGALNLKTLPAAQLNATTYNDWGYASNAACAAIYNGGPTGSTAAGWGAPWLLGTGPNSGLAYLPTNNKDPYNSACSPGPNLWSASILAINETSGQWVWGFQMTAHETWDWDCSWWQALGNETVNGVSTQVLWKTCKSGYLVELNAATGALIWSWTPPASIYPRCLHYCYPWDPLNSTQMNLPFLNPSLKPTLIYPGPAGGFEDESSYNPTLNYIFVDYENLPGLAYYVPMNITNYKSNSGMAFYNAGGGPLLAGHPDVANNNTAFAINAATGQMVWNHFIPTQGYRGGLTNSGNVVYLTLSSGDFLMLNAQTGATIKDLFIGGPLNVLPSIGATASGTMEVIFPITAGVVSWGTGVPGDIVALSLQNVPAAGGTTTTSGGGTITTTSTTTIATTVTASATSTGFSATTVYGIAAVAVILAISTGYLAITRGRKPAS